MSKKISFNERAQHILRTMVQRFICDGMPVGSKALTCNSGIDLSSATIRHVMSDLEGLGYIKSPHTSAGRIPTEKGYRFFVDALLRTEALQLKKEIEFNINLDADSPKGVYDSASNLLSGLTQMAAVVMLPRHDSFSLRQIEFLPLSDNRVLAILVVNEEEVENRIIHTERSFSSSELVEIANYLNESFGGKDLSLVREKILSEMKEHKDSMNQMMCMAITMAEKVFGDSDNNKEDYILAGQTNLMGFAELSGADRLKDLFKAFNQKQEVLQLLDKCISADGVQIFIGQESGYDVFDGCSFVTSPYSVNGDPVGVLGVIGPTRMAYDRIIPVVDMTAKLLSAAIAKSCK